MTELTTAQREVLRGLPGHFPPGRIDRLWVFPPHQAKGRESGFIVLSLLPQREAHFGASGEGEDTRDDAAGDTRRREAEIPSLVGEIPPASSHDPSLRALVTVRYEAEAGRGAALEVVERATEEGWAPSERIERVIAGVSRRSGLEPAEPHVEEIGGSEEGWGHFLERAGLIA